MSDNLISFSLLYIQQHILKTHSLQEYRQLHPFDWQLIIMTAFLANIDGQFTYFEEHKIKRTFKHFFNQNQQNIACESIKKADVKEINWRLLINEFKSFSSEDDRLQVLTFLFEVACTDGSLADEELSFIHQLSQDFQVTELSFLKLLDKYKMWNKTFRSKEIEKLNDALLTDLQNTRLRALTVLGLMSNANEAEIKKRYRILMKKHHPDANPHLTAKEMIFHRQQMFKINEAYDILLKQD